MYNGPPRGGTRGGRDQFNWEDVKGDKVCISLSSSEVKIFRVGISGAYKDSAFMMTRKTTDGTCLLVSRKLLGTLCESLGWEMATR